MKATYTTIKQTALATAMSTALGLGIVPLQTQAATLTFSFDGWFTMINAGGTDALVNGDSASQAFYGRRTAVTGTLMYDDVAGTGSAMIDGFSFFGSGLAIATTISFQTIGDGAGGAGTLMLGNMGFNWNTNNGIPVSIVWDAEGFLDAVANPALAVGDTLGPDGATFDCDINLGCALPGTEPFLFDFGKSSYTLPIGASPITTTSFNTTDIGTPALGTNPSGTLPLTDDGISGSPMPAGPFPGFNANFDLNSLTLLNDGSASVTQPADVPVNNFPENPGPPQVANVNLGAATAAPGTAEYCLTGIVDCNTNGWIAAAGNNPITVPVTQTVNTLTVDWRESNAGAFATQTVTVTVADTVAPSIATTPGDVSVDVDSTSDEVCFSSDAIGHLTASDIWDSAPSVEYSLDGFTFLPSNNGAGEMDCSSDFPPGTGFNAGANTVSWRAEDASGNTSTYAQTVTLNLPTGIVGEPCSVDLDYAGLRNTLGDFIMRDPTGAQVGTTDTGVTGVIDTTLLCTDPVCDLVGTTLEAGQPFQSLLWFADPVTLYGPGDWTFQTCLGTPDVDEPGNCANTPPPGSLSMTVKTAAANNGVPQLGAHMLFEWGTTRGIDVVVVWDVDCGASELTTTDPDGDGILGTRMVDGPFIGFNAAFDMSATGVDPDGNPVPLITDGGFSVNIPAYKNPTPNSSPLPMTATQMSASDFPADASAIISCDGGCYDFETNGVIAGSDSNGAYQFVQVVLPLSEPIPFWSLYRKFDADSGEWGEFVVNGRNIVMSAPIDENGFCPEPGAGDYKVADTNSQLAGKLQEGDQCIQLVVEDNGPNDSNPAVGTVADPSGVAEVAEPPLPDPETQGGGGCSLSQAPVDAAQRADWWLLGGLLGWLGVLARRRKLH